MATRKQKALAKALIDNQFSSAKQALLDAHYSETSADHHQTYLINNKGTQEALKEYGSKCGLTEDQITKELDKIVLQDKDNSAKLKAIQYVRGDEKPNTLNQTLILNTNDPAAVIGAIEAEMGAIRELAQAIADHSGQEGH